MREYTHMSQPTQHQSNHEEREETGNPYTLLGALPIARNKTLDYQIDEDDLDEHFYVLGRSGSGKSNLLIRLALADIARGSGLCFIDPIGSTAETLLSHIPDALDFGTKRMRQKECDGSRQQRQSTIQNTRRDGTRSNGNNLHRSVKDVIYIDFANSEFPVGINPLYNIAPEDRPKAVSDILELFSSIWHDTGWGPRMESIFRAALHTLIENPNCSRPSLLSVFNLLLDQEYRASIKTDLSNKQVTDWWDLRFDRGDLNERTRREWVEPVLNKIDTLSLDPLIRNIIGQPRCKLDFDKIIKRKQILIINLNQHKIGNDNAAFIGMLILARIRQAASKEAVKDKDQSASFCLTLDEAHSFPTTELTRIINQGRHSNLYARIAHQHLEQFDPKIASTLRNGCGSLAAFAVGQRDAQILADDLSRTSHDQFLRLLSNLKKAQAILRLTQQGSPRPANTTPVEIHYQSSCSRNPEAFARFTRERFGTPKLRAEFQIETAHAPLNREEYLHWKSRFANETHIRRREHQYANRQAKRNRNMQEMNFGKRKNLEDHIAEAIAQSRAITPNLKPDYETHET